MELSKHHKNLEWVLKIQYKLLYNFTNPITHDTNFDNGHYMKFLIRVKCQLTHANLILWSANIPLCHQKMTRVRWVRVHNRIVSPQNHCQNTTLNDHYIYKIIFLVDFLNIRYSHTFWFGGDFLWFGWLKHVLKCPERWFRNRVSLHNFIEKDSIGLTIFIQIAPYFNHK
jgi:hypothetical protein